MRMACLNKVSDIVSRYGANRSQCKAEILTLVRTGKAKPQVVDIDGAFKVVVDGFVLESFNTANAANFYCKRVTGG